MTAGSLQITKSAIRAMVIASLAVGVANCSKRNPNVDTQAPAKSPSPTPKPPLQTIPGGPLNNNAMPYRPGSPISPGAPISPGSPSAPISPGTPRPPYSPGSPYSPGYPNNNNNGVRPPGVNPPNNNNYVPPRPNIIPNPPVVPAQPPGAGASAINVMLSLAMDDDLGPVVMVVGPPTISGYGGSILALTGTVDSTSAEVVLKVSNAGKTCASERIAIGVFSKPFTLTCK
jgi:hypothetical protein